MPEDAAAETCKWPESLDAMQAAPQHHQVPLENEHVPVLEAWVAPGDTVPVHAHCWPAVLHILGSSDFVRHDRHGAVIFDSRVGTAPPPPGVVAWAAALPPHSLANVGPDQIKR